MAETNTAHRDRSVSERSDGRASSASTPFADEGPPANLDKTVVIGCGNILRGDDAVGPTLIRHLWSRGGVPDHVTLVDGGTAGMDVAFKMRGAAHVVLIDAAQTGQTPGTIFRIPGSEIEALPELQALHSHSFRWDHALAFGHWLLGEQYPRHVTVFLIEITSCEPGAELSEPVAAAMLDVGRFVTELWDAELSRGERSGAELGDADRSESPPVTNDISVHITADGNLRLDAAVARRFFPGDALVASLRGDELWLFPLTGPEGGGLLLKQRNSAGDRSTLIWEALPPADPPVGICTAIWDAENAVLRVDVSARPGSSDLPAGSRGIP